jgi:hypothetical protein
MESDVMLDHLLALVKHYRKKLEDGDISGTEANVYLRALGVLGIRDVVLRTKHLELYGSNDPNVLELPFDAKE